MINAQTLQGQWNQVKGALRQHWVRHPRRMICGLSTATSINWWA